MNYMITAYINGVVNDLQEEMLYQIHFMMPDILNEYLKLFSNEEILRYHIDPQAIEQFTIEAIRNASARNPTQWDKIKKSAAESTKLAIEQLEQIQKEAKNNTFKSNKKTKKDSKKLKETKKVKSEK